MRKSRAGVNSYRWKLQILRRNAGTEGSVSIFLIMVLAFVFLFTSVLIDYARIAAANVQEERLARAAVRSVMSSYDVELRENYGLFAFGGKDGTQLLSVVLNDNFYESGRGDAFNLLPLKLDSSALNLSRPLGSYEVFRRGIMEEMKYKAPIDFALELAGKFKPLSAAMGEASRSTKVLGKLQPLYDEREAALDQMMQKRKEAAESGRELQKLIMNPPGNLIASTALGGISSAADIAAMYSDYVGKYYADLYRDKKKEYARYTTEINRYLNQTGELIPKIPRALSEFLAKHAKLMAEAGSALRKAAELNEQMGTILEQSRSSGAENAQYAAQDWDIPGSGGELSAEALRRLREQEEALIIGAAEFSTMESNISAQELSFRSVEPAVSGLPGVLNQAGGLNADTTLLNTSVLTASQAVNGYLLNYGNGGGMTSAQTAQIENHRTSDAERKGMEQQAKTRLGDAMRLLDQLRTLGNSASAATERYGLLRQYSSEISSFNNGMDDGMPVNGGSTTDPYSAGSLSMDKVDGLYRAIGSILEGARDRLYQTEYSAQYFPHFEVSQLTPLVTGPVSDYAEALAASLDPHAQELEYVLYGFHNSGGNLAAAYGEIFALRLAVRTMEGLTESARYSNPLAVLAAALLYGVRNAVQDMLQLCKTGEIPLSKYLDVNLSYRDYLRLFMLLHGAGEGQLSRMLALIRLNTGINPLEKYTYASSEIRMGLRLWFLPGVVKLLDYTAGLPGDVQDKVYYRTVKADYSY
ncbi:hypothetical protein C2I18_17865 [Paenibacillus sp. PK3_47]|uniref:hypothetical protein n=1 Tax=Paenibacillus sp. PK3_47 TaxID=2072642 RepID=UPI00201E2D36|nr:hypothetical protein [Paenibacillus sp. PK3_47]UQZ35220.1 hypothetical protein C2I18_17865 [Paenibacillus sp. PK3_47]